ncbi:MAG: hypothetical protein AAB612_01135 [Patescibacteria group bacterium]
MIFSFHIFKIIQLAMLLIWCFRFRPSLRWCLVAAAIPALSLFIPGSYESGDFTAHIVRTMDLVSSLQHGIFPVRWAWLLNSGYGYPLFSFFASLPYYVLSAIYLAGTSYVFGMKLYLALVYLFAVGSMWFCASAIFAQEKQSKVIATISAVLYAFTPYMLINLEFRAAMGELTGFALFPLLVFAVLRERRVLFCFTLTALILSHPGITLLGVPWIILLIILLKKVRMFALPIALAGGLVSSYLIPSLVEAKFTEQAVTAQTVWWNTKTFQPISYLFWSPWRFGFLLQGHQGEVAYGPGVAQWGFFAISIYLFVKKKLSQHNTRIFLALGLLTLLGLFMMLPYSANVWNSVPLIRKLQFPTRIMFYPTFSLALIGGYVFVTLGFKKLFFHAMLFLCLGWTVLNWSHRAYRINIDDDYLRSHMSTESFQFEHLPEAMPVLKQNGITPRTSAFSIQDGRMTAKAEIVEPIIRKYIVDVQRDSVFQENTLFFPGWIAIVDGRERDLTIAQNGTMLVSLHPGETSLEFIFTNTPIREWSNRISAIFLGIVTVWVYLQFKTVERKRHA